MSTKELTSLLISDFTLDILAGYLSNDPESPKINSISAPFGQVDQVLRDHTIECWKGDIDFAVIWTQPESVAKSFKDLLNYQPVSIDKIMAEVDEYCAALMNLKQRLDFAFVPTWTIPSYQRGYGILDMKNGIGITNTIDKMNLRLSENLDPLSQFYLLNAQNWLQIAGKNAFNPKLWYLAKIPFGNQVFKEATKDIKSAIRAIAGNSKKLIILDLDDTLWGGIVGDVGCHNLKLGGHDPIGEAFVDFQHALKSMTNRGVLLAIVSKNEESVALHAINNHPDMVLRMQDFAAWKINWNDKAQNVVDLVSYLNLGLESVVYIDDNSVERARVREALPEVVVCEWPENKMLYKSTLLSLPHFDTASITEEDAKRTKMYVAERERDSLKRKVGSLDEWIRTLETRVKVQELEDCDLQRALQLLNKTNQMNLSTRRMTQRELVDWVECGKRKMWTVRVSDKCGHAGLTGIVGIDVEKGSKTGQIIDFILSCRVMGRKIEETMVYSVVEYARSIGLERIYAKYMPTAKNKPCLEFWMRSGFSCQGGNDTFTWDLECPYPLPDGVEIE